MGLPTKPPEECASVTCSESSAEQWPNAAIHGKAVPLQATVEIPGPERADQWPEEARPPQPHERRRGDVRFHSRLGQWPEPRTGEHGSPGHRPSPPQTAPQIGWGRPGPGVTVHGAGPATTERRCRDGSGGHPSPLSQNGGAPRANPMQRRGARDGGSRAKAPDPKVRAA